MNKIARQVQVSVPLPLDQPLTYLWPENCPVKPAVGYRVLVPLGRRRVAGYLVEIAADEETRQHPAKDLACREVLEVLDEEPLFGKRQLNFYQWVAQYYLAPLGEVLRTALPISMHLRGYKALRTLPQGLWALEKGVFLTRQEEEILLTLRRTGKLTFREVEKRLGKAPTRWIGSLERKGFVETCQIFRGKQKHGRRGATLVWTAIQEAGAAVEDLLALLSLEEADICRHLLHHGPCSQDEMEKAFPRFGDVLPGLLQKGFVQTGSAISGMFDRTGAPRGTVPAPVLNREQEQAVTQILAHASRSGFSSFLLHGVTGSGKTEVYLRVIEQVLRAGREALVLVPEIGLTPQTLARFASRFGPNLAALHSRLSEGERLDFWWKIRRGQIRIAIGARSAVFAPFQNLGVIVVDEEHDPSYKQQDRVRYNGRDLALVRGKQEQSVVILGSATPSLESYYNASKGKHILIELKERIEKRPVPEVVLVDLRDPAVRMTHGGSITSPLGKAIGQTLQEKKKCLLFLNRRGYSQTLICRGCGHLFRCPRCSVTLTYHLSSKALCCHYCEHQRPAPGECPSCKGAEIRTVGHGTERIEEEIQRRFPGARIGRMDRDTTRRKGSHEEILARFRHDGMDILIGTQMIAKGHDIPAVTLVGVISGDVALDLPDFRASERTFQLLLQVAGRAGRGPWPGRVLIQTRHPEHFCIQSVLRQDYRAFYEQEIAFRKSVFYPPFCRMINLRMSGTDESATRETALQVGAVARSMLAENPHLSAGLEILGPSQAPLSRLRGRFRFHFFLRSSKVTALLGFTGDLVRRARPLLSAKRIGLEVDVDPIQVL